MNTIKIGSIENNLDEVSESWINQQIRERQHQNGSVCVQVRIQQNGVDIILSTPECSGGGGGGGRMATPQEQDILDRWNHLHLNSLKWSVGEVIAFLKQVKLL